MTALFLCKHLILVFFAPYPFHRIYVFIKLPDTAEKGLHLHLSIDNF